VALTSRPALSWVVPLVRSGQRQDGYRIRARRRDDDRILWDSGDVASNQNSDVIWAGEPLAGNDAVRWQVLTLDEQGTASPWSEPAEFVVPPLSADDWAGEWISVAPGHAAVVDVALRSRVRSAVLHFAAQGLVRVELDGRCVNAGARDPSDTALRRVVSRSYDVTAHLVGDAVHELALIGARGHLHNVIDRVRMLAELRITYDDGSEQVIATSAAWRELPTTLVREEPFYVETHDAREPARGRGELVRSGETIDAVGQATVPDLIEPDAGPPLRTVRIVEGAVLSSSPDVVVVDLGENIAGRSTVRVRGTVSGQRITVHHGELLHDGRVSTLNISLPDDRDRERQVVDWTCGDTGHEQIEPWFAVHGFRYLEVRGLGAAHLESVTAAVVHSDAEQTGTFATSDPLLDRLVEVARQTQLNNTHSHPEDCPTREQAGWTGDAAAAAEAALCHLDMAGVYRNWLADVALDQDPDGGVLGVSPFLLGPEHKQPADPVWGAALTEVPLQYWLATGDPVLIRRLLPAMRRWADYQVAVAPEGLVTEAAISYGADWLALEQTPPVILQTAAAERSLRTLARLEAALGDRDAASTRERQADVLRSAARTHLWDESTATWANGSQASLGVALAAGWVESDEEDAVAARLRDAMAASDGRLRSGYAGTQPLVRALGSIPGGDALLLATVHEPSEPGVGAMLATGPGTFWETWWYEEPTVGIASLDHIGLVAPIAAWAWQAIGGIAPIEPGYRIFSVDPRPGAVSSAAVTRWTPRGLIEVRWVVNGGSIELTVAVPVGSNAVLPDGRTLGSGTHEVVLGLGPELPPAPAATSPRHPSRWWLGHGEDSAAWTGDGVRTTPDAQRWVCSPVFHEPLDPPIREVVFESLEVGAAKAIRLELAESFIPAGGYVHAMFDMDTGTLPGQEVVPFIAVLGARGSVRRGTTRWLPIAWNRVAVDLEDWPVGEPIVGLDLGVEWTGRFDTARGPRSEVPDAVRDFAIRVGDVGATPGRRTW
jgi:alpha-L-rhamnosidase